MLANMFKRYREVRISSLKINTTDWKEGGTELNFPWKQGIRVNTIDYHISRHIFRIKQLRLQYKPLSRVSSISSEKLSFTVLVCVVISRFKRIFLFLKFPSCSLLLSLFSVFYKFIRDVSRKLRPRRLRGQLALKKTVYIWLIFNRSEKSLHAWNS